jgi:hypothetical protein
MYFFVHSLIKYILLHTLILVCQPLILMQFFVGSKLLESVLTISDNFVIYLNSIRSSNYMYMVLRWKLFMFLLISTELIPVSLYLLSILFQFLKHGYA